MLATISVALQLICPISYKRVLKLKLLVAQGLKGSLELTTSFSANVSALGRELFRRLYLSQESRH